MARKSTDLTLNFLGDYDSLKKTFRKATGDLDKFDKKVKGSGKNNGFRNIGKAALGAAAGIGAVSIAANEVKKSVSGTVELAKATRQLQRATGLASEDASRLAAVLKVRGMDTNKVGRSFTTLARQIEAAKTGTGAAADAFTRLGVSQKAIKSGNFNQVLLGIANGFAKLGDGTSKASVAQQLFGRNSRDLLPLLEGGSQKLREQLALAPQLSAAQVKQSLAMVNAQRQVDLALMNVRTTLGTALLPVLSDGANKLAKFVTQMKTGKGAGGEFARKVKEIWTAIKPAASALLDAAKAIFEFAAANPKLVRMGAYLGAIGLAVKGIKFAGAISGMGEFLRVAKGLTGRMKSRFASMGASAGASFADEAGATAASNINTSFRKGGRAAKFRKAGVGIGGLVAAGVIAGVILWPDIKKKISESLKKLRADIDSGGLGGLIRELGNRLKAVLMRSLKNSFNLFGQQPFAAIGSSLKGLNMSSGSRRLGAQTMAAAASMPLGARTAAAQGPMSLGRPTAGKLAGVSEAQIAERTLRLTESQAALEANIEQLSDRKDKRAKRALHEMKVRLSLTKKELAELDNANTIIQARRSLEDQIGQLRLNQLNRSLDSRDSARQLARNKNALEDFRNEYARLTGEMGVSSDFTTRNKELTDLIAQTRGEQGSAAVQANYQRQRTRLNAQIARADARGDLETKDQLNAQLAALDERYGADRLKRLMDEQAALKAEEEKRRADAKEERDRLVIEEQQRTDDIKRSNNEAASATYAFTGAIKKLIDGLVNGAVTFTQFASQLARMGGPSVSKTDTTAGVLGKTTGSIAVPGIPAKPKGKKKASGGLLTPSALTLVGETGPELIMASGKGMNVMSATRTQRLGGDTNITINATGAAANDPRLLAREIGWQLATR